MINSTSTTTREKSFITSNSLRSMISGLLIVLLSLANLSVMAGPAKAISVDASAATFNFDYATKATVISGTSGSNNNAIIKYTNITDTPLSGISIDAVVTTTLTNATVSNYDSIGNASSNVDYFQVNGGFTGSYGTMVYKFEFFESGTYTGAGTGIPVVLNNVSITSIDLDGSTGGTCQFTDFTGFQSYVLSQSSAINVLTNATDARVPVGTTRFIATSCVTTFTNRVEDAVQVHFDSVSTFSASFGLNGSGSTNYFGIAFEPMPALFAGASLANPVSNPSNQTPTSTNTTRYYVNGQSSIVQLQDFGTYADPDGNPFNKAKITTLPTTGSLEKFVNGSWVAVSVNDEILVSDISNGNLRFTGTINDSLQFKVSDGVDYSTAAYTMTLLVSNQSQTITFTNPGAKTPTSPSFASGATASSGLTVTLTSLTPGVCTVSGLNIVPVASGTCTIVASQAGNSTYGAATSVTQTFPISTLTPQTITAPNPGNQTWGGSSSTVTVSPTASSNLTVTLISLNPAVCTVSGFVITIVGPGNCTIRNVQNGNGTYSSAPPVEYTFVVSAAVSTYTITYLGNTNTGGSVPSNTTGNGNVTLATNSNTLVKTGYTFNGWNTAANGTGTHYAVSATYNLTADVTLYAEWTADVVNYSITYHGNGNTGGTAAPNTTGASGSNVTVDTNTGTFVKTGYRFAGWNTAANGTGTYYEGGDSIQLNGNMNLYAVWTALSYTITFDGNSNTGGTVPAVVTGYGSKTLRSNTGNLALTNYTFKGWNTQADGLGTHYNVGAAYNLLADVTLYAEWVLTPAVIYNPNGATGGTTPSEIPANSPITIDPNTGNLIRAGFRFLGWNTQPNGGGTHYAAGMTPVLPVGTVLYAEWEPIDSLASTGSTYGNEFTGAAALIGLGLFVNAIATIRRRRIKA